MINSSDSLEAQDIAMQIEEIQFREQKKLERWLEDRLARIAQPEPQAFPHGRWSTQPKRAA